MAHFKKSRTRVYLSWQMSLFCAMSSVTIKKSPNVSKNCPKMISKEKLKILTPLQKLPKNVRDFGKLIVAQSPINRPIWSHWRCALLTVKSKY